MPAPPLPREDAQAAVDTWRACGGNVTLAAERMGLARGTMQSRLDIAARYGMLLDHAPAMPGFEVSKVTITEGADGSLKGRSIVQRPQAGNAFALPDGHRVKGVSVLLDEEGRELARWVKTREGETDPVALETAIREALADVPRAEIAATLSDADADLLTLYALPDLHLGLLSYAPETGERYDLKSAAVMVQREIGALVAMSPPSQNAVILVLGDFFHGNDQTNTTPTSNHQLDVDSRWEHVYGVGARTLIALAHAVASRHERVEIAIIPGNHDQDAARTLRVALDLHFEAHDRISVYGKPSEHWYRRFGKVLIGAHHGHKMKPDRMAMMLAADRPEDWGAAKYRHFLFGHVHHETAKEVGPVRVESFQSPAAKDAYAASIGYRSGRSLTAITFHAERGERYRHRVNIEATP